jgi:hypothetical protein
MVFEIYSTLPLDVPRQTLIFPPSFICDPGEWFDDAGLVYGRVEVGR